jgi:hypothetical protein
MKVILPADFAFGEGEFGWSANGTRNTKRHKNTNYGLWGYV